MNNQFENAGAQMLLNLPTPAELEKRSLRANANKIGAAVIAVFLIIRFWAYGYYAVMGIWGFNMQSAYNIISDQNILQCVEVLLSAVVFFFPFFLCALSSKVKLARAFRRPKKGSSIPYLLFGVGACVLANLANSYLGAFFEGLGVNYDAGLGNYPRGIWGFVLSVISTAVVPAFMEEFAFRGVVFTILEKYGKGFAIVCSSILFGVIHGNFEQMFFAAIVGFALGFIRAKTASVWVAIAVHGINNLMSVLLSFSSRVFSTELQAAVNLIYFIAALGLGVLGVILILRGDKGAEIKEKVTENPKKTLYRTFWFSPAVIIVAVIYFYQSASYFFN